MSIDNKVLLKTASPKLNSKTFEPRQSKNSFFLLQV